MWKVAVTRLSHYPSLVSLHTTVKFLHRPSQADKIKCRHSAFLQIKYNVKCSRLICIILTFLQYISHSHHTTCCSICGNKTRYFLQEFRTICSKKTDICDKTSGHFLAEFFALEKGYLWWGLRTICSWKSRYFEWDTGTSYSGFHGNESEYVWQNVGTIWNREPEMFKRDDLTFSSWVRGNKFEYFFNQQPKTGFIWQDIWTICCHVCGDRTV